MLRSAATTVPFTIRGAVDADAQAVIWVHRAAVRRTAAAFYTPTIVDAWAAKDNSETVRRTREEIADEAMVVIVAEENAKVVAFGMIVPGDEELRAVYVHPDAGRRGIGTAILQRLEESAIERGATRLQLHSSINAEAFYARQEYTVVDRTRHRLRSGVEMACVTMTKELSR